MRKLPEQSATSERDVPRLHELRHNDGLQLALHYFHCRCGGVGDTQGLHRCIFDGRQIPWLLQFYLDEYLRSMR